MSNNLKELVSEFVGTAVLLAFGGGVVAMLVLWPGGGLADHNGIAMGWAIAVTLGIYASKYSGSHINPAVTLSLAVSGDFPWNKVPGFMIAQVLGAMFGAAIVFADFYAQFMVIDPGLTSTSGIFFTSLAVPSSPMSGIIDQIIGTFLLVFLIGALGSGLGKDKAGWLAPILVGGIVFAIGTSFGAMHGYAINPARDFGPRLFTAIVGFEGSFSGAVWLIPIIGPFIGGVLGGLAFKYLKSIY